MKLLSTALIIFSIFIQSSYGNQCDDVLYINESLALLNERDMRLLEQSIGTDLSKSNLELSLANSQNISRETDIRCGGLCAINLIQGLRVEEGLGPLPLEAFQSLSTDSELSGSMGTDKYLPAFSKLGEIEEDVSGQSTIFDQGVVLKYLEGHANPGKGKSLVNSLSLNE